MKFNLESSIKKLDVSMNKLAIMADIRPNTINDLVKGTTKRIELETLEKLLTAMNDLASNKRLNYAFQIQDIIEYENDSMFNPDFNGIITKEYFDSLRTILVNTTIFTSIPGYDKTTVSVLKLMYIFADDLLRSLVFWLPIKDLTPKEKSLFNIRYHLSEHHLAEITNGPSDISLNLTEKGREFIELLMRYGTDIN
ncbi:helix-turn-helix domain-containing protein [Paenibacillus donghaensis]|uniref:HTH cro/C1-type domain-containing protein n=1 Tax=Paenibacillus donghaensis TaxID=414771 RepID=A0A2Z2KFE0_9BACL|nr:helix-turn-helix transcriptional regulator [Paenibacillus donghaensis]ASA21843.1 hypothetical protein B9T62_14295 [Paenibacillus donghaensis]